MSFAESVNKKEIIEQYKINPQDVGSSNVQVALLTKRLEVLTEHMKKHPKDKHSQRGMMKIVNSRKQQLQYLRNTDVEGYRKLIAALGIRK